MRIVLSDGAPVVSALFASSRSWLTAFGACVRCAVSTKGREGLQSVSAEDPDVSVNTLILCKPPLLRSLQTLGFLVASLD